MTDRIEIIRRASLKAGNPATRRESGVTSVASSAPPPTPRHTGSARGDQSGSLPQSQTHASASIPDSRRVHRALPNFCFVRY